MPSSNPLDPTNYLALLPSDKPKWHGGGGSVTWSFLSTVPGYYDLFDSGTYSVDGYFVGRTESVALTASQRALVQQAVNLFNDVANVRLTSTSGVGDITFGAHEFPNFGLYGFAYFPSGAGLAGDIWLNNTITTVRNPVRGDEGWVTILHELGHALGLKHPFEDGVLLPSSVDSNKFSVMSYSAHPVTDLVWPSTLMLYDIQALQHLYGANRSTRASDTTYFGSGPGSFNPLADNDAVIATIWDGGGFDTFDASNQTRAVRIDLREGHFSSIGSLTDNVAVAFGAVIENAKGGRGNDTLTGNAHGNVLTGGAGDDVLDGQGGNDTAAYAGASGAVRVSLAISGAQATGGAGSDRLISIESLSGSSFADTLTGNGGANRLWGGNGGDTLSGGGGNDTLLGADGWDSLVGGAGNDLLSGNGHRDTLVGGGGNDTLWGGADRDTFVFDSAPSGSGNVDFIGDFSPSDDTIALARAAFTQAGAIGALTKAAFRKGSAAADATDRIIYEAATGAIYYDADGIGGQVQVRLATVKANLVLTSEDFVIV